MWEGVLRCPGRRAQRAGASLALSGQTVDMSKGANSLRQPGVCSRVRVQVMTPFLTSLSPFTKTPCRGFPKCG